MSRAGMASRAKRVPLHPGEVLREEFLKPLKLSASRLAQALDVTTPRVRLMSAGVANARWSGGVLPCWPVTVKPRR